MFRRLATLVAMPLLVVAACASEGDPGAIEVKTGAAAVSALRAAPEVAAEAGTSQFEMVMEMAASGESFEIVASGAFDEAARQMAMSMDMASLYGMLAGDDDVPSDGGDATLEMVADGDTVYVRSPLFDLMTGASGWLSMTVDELGAYAGQVGIGANDPSAILEALRGVGGEPEVVGQEEVRGVATTHYRASVSLSEALADVPEAEREELTAALEQLGDTDGAEVPVDVWIDEDGLPRRMKMDMSSAFGAITGADGAMTMTIDLFGYGEPVDIEVPPADEVTPISETVGWVERFLGS